MTAEEIKIALTLCSHEADGNAFNRCCICPARYDITGKDCGLYLPEIALGYILELEAGAMKKEESK